MNMFGFVDVRKIDVRVCSMFDKMVFDPSLLSSSSLWPLLCLMKHFSRRKTNDDKEKPTTMVS